MKTTFDTSERIETEAALTALLIQSRTPKKSFVFLLEEKIGRAQIQKARNIFLCGCGVRQWRGEMRTRFAILLEVVKTLKKNHVLARGFHFSVR